ncbi:MAG: 1-acyl-sn-glycerol-3-phosphate acyltransferase, partial [Saprospiraceae bacterium]
RKPFFRWLLENANMFPVFRARDGYTERDRNDGVFEFCEKKLLGNQVVTIYVEGEHHLEKRLRTVQKGLARIAFSTYEKHQLRELQVIPVGCNYQYGDRPREEAMLNVGQPLFIRDYWEEYQRSPGTAITHLNKDLEAGLKQICFHLESPDDDELAEQLLTLHRSDRAEPLLPVVQFDSRRFAGEKGVLDWLNALAEPAKSHLRKSSADYFSALQQAGLEDEALLHPGRGALGWILLLVLGALPALLGWISSLPIRWLTYEVADKKVKKKEFYGSVILGVGYLSGLLYYLIWLVAGLCTGNPRWIALALLLPLLGWWSIFYRELVQRWWTARIARQHPQRADLLEMRAGIFENLR